MTLANFTKRTPWKNKYRNQPVVDPEHGRFDSKREYARFLELRLLERGKEIHGLKRQVPFALNVQGHHICKYIADFTYTERGQFTIEDAKGVRTPEYKIKRALMRAIFGWEIKET